MWFESSFLDEPTNWKISDIKNQSEGTEEMCKLLEETDLMETDSWLWTIVGDDINNDGNLDCIISGIDENNEPSMELYQAKLDFSFSEQQTILPSLSNSSIVIDDINTIIIAIEMTQT